MPEVSTSLPTFRPVAKPWWKFREPACNQRPAGCSQPSAPRFRAPSTLSTPPRPTADFPNAIRQIGTVQGHAYQDANGDGLKAAGDNPMAGIAVYVDVNNSLTLDAGEPVRSTDQTGAYSFVGLRAGSYRISQVLPAGNVGAVAAPSSQLVNVFSGSTTTLDFYNVVPVVGSITGKVYDDADASGVQGSAETGLAGRQVFVDRNNNGLVDTGEPQATTAADGSYT